MYIFSFLPDQHNLFACLKQDFIKNFIEEIKNLKIIVFNY